MQKTPKKDNTEGMLKGRMAEMLVEELLKKSGNKVYRFGYEAITQNLVQPDEVFDGHTEVGQKIRTIPDFIVVNKKGIPEFVEVKFRWNAEPNEKDTIPFQTAAKYWKAPIILVSCKEKPYFRVMMPPYFDAKGNFKFVPLERVSEWNIDKNALAVSEELVATYLGSTMINRSKLLGKVLEF
jgi:hypothetical protein